MNEAMSGRRRSYDHRQRELACEEGNAHLLEGMDVPRSTVSSWLRRGPRAVVTLDVVTKDTIELQAEDIRLRGLRLAAARRCRPDREGREGVAGRVEVGRARLGRWGGPCASQRRAGRGVQNLSHVIG